MRPLPNVPGAGRVVAAAARARARLRVRPLERGVTVVTVNWNSVRFLEVLVGAVRRFSPPATRILVVDNASTDGTAEFLRAHPELGRVRLPWNLGHARALDIGCLSVRTDVLVTLDVDAFPIREDWLDALLVPLESGCAVSGARLNREYVHPCCLAMHTKRFVERGLSFRANYVDGAGDVGESLSADAGGPLSFLEKTRQYGPGDVGTVFGDVVYHNFYSTRFDATSASTLDGAVARDDPARAWDRAVSEFLR